LAAVAGNVAFTLARERAGCCVTLRSHAIGIDPPLRDATP